jgi:hypothetical protein
MGTKTKVESMLLETAGFLTTVVLLGISEAWPFFNQTGGLLHFFVACTNKSLAAFHLKLVEIYSNDSLFTSYDESSESD